MKRLSLVLLLAIANTAACSGETASIAATPDNDTDGRRSTTSSVASAREHRASPARDDDAPIVFSTGAELAAHGRAKLGEITAGATGTHIDIIFENTADKPLRAGKLDVIVLNKDGVVATSTIPSSELTVPPKAKATLQVTTSLAPDKVGTVRLYGKDLAR